MSLHSLTSLIRSSIPYFILKNILLMSSKFHHPFMALQKHLHLGSDGRLVNRITVGYPQNFYESLGPEEPSPRPSLPSPNTWVEVSMFPATPAKWWHSHRSIPPGTMPGWLPPPEGQGTPLGFLAKDYCPAPRRQSLHEVTVMIPFYTLQKTNIALNILMLK